MSLTRTAAGRMWGSPGQRASQLKAAEASARKRRKHHVEPKPKAATPKFDFDAEWAKMQKIPDLHARDKRRRELNRLHQEQWLEEPNEAIPEITNRERRAMVTYSRPPAPGATEALSATLNTRLRRDEELADPDRQLASEIDAAIRKAAPLSEPVTVQRVITNKAVREEILANLNNPDYLYVDKGYGSMEAKGTSPNLTEMAARYSGGAGDQDRREEQIFIEADLPAGAQAFDMSRLAVEGGEIPGGVEAQEREYLMPRGTRWKVERQLPTPDAPAPVIKMSLVDDPRRHRYSAVNVTSGGAMKATPPRRKRKTA